MTPKQRYYELAASGIIKNLAKRQIEGYYCADRQAAVKQALALLPKGASVGWGGSQTLGQLGLMEALEAGGYELIDRGTARTPQEQQAMKARLFTCDAFLMSTNAITLDGLLINIDAYGSRVAYLCHGPGMVLVFAGMNKMAPDLDAGIKRARNLAAPPNNLRLDTGNPCTHTGFCNDCLSRGTICCQFVVTRYNAIPGRLKVILVGEELGY
ncbi:MAG: LUD domain-containing protein [Clostridiales bacterium]|nr:LUD domain-containing protein [Clostridiales bacterium]